VRATWVAQADGNVVHIAQQAVIDPLQGSLIELSFVCADEGVLMGARVLPPPGEGTVWCPPRLALPPGEWDGYLFWDQAVRRRVGKMSELGK